MSVNHLQEELTRIIDYFRLEYDLNYAEIIGTLAILQAELSDELLVVPDEEEEDEY